MPHFLIIANVNHAPSKASTAHVQEFSAPCLITASKATKVMAEFVSKKVVDPFTTIHWEFQELTDLDVPPDPPKPTPEDTPSYTHALAALDAALDHVAIIRAYNTDAFDLLKRADEHIHKAITCLNNGLK